jgi:hypothetical protein
MQKAGLRLGWLLFVAALACGVAPLLLTGGLAQAPEDLESVPESRHRMGINLSPYRMDTGEPIDDPIVDDLDSVGAKWMRLEFMARQSPPAIRRDHYHTVLDRLRAHDIRALGLLDYTTVPSPRVLWGTTEYRDEFVSIAAGLVDEFRDDIDHWEIWNEQDIGYDPEGPGGDTYMSPQDYAYLLGGDPTADANTHPWAAQGIYGAIKDADPSAVVLLGGLSNAWKAADGRGAGNYLAELYESLSLLGYGSGSWPFDVVAVHPYYGRNPNPTVYLFGGGDYILRANIWSVMDAHDDGSKRIWITEIGWNTNTTQWVCMPPFVSEEDQAAYLESSWSIFLGEPTGNGRVLVDKVFWYRYQDSGIQVDPTQCPVATATPGAYVSTEAEAYERIRPPRITPTPSSAEFRPELVTIDSWWGLVHGHYVPKPSYYTYQEYELLYHVHLPLVLAEHSSP